MTEQPRFTFMTDRSGESVSKPDQASGTPGQMQE